jgi:electron transport complex protein RnfG
MKNIAGMMKLGIILAGYAAVACVLLAFVYAGTKTIIDERAEADQQQALKDIFPDADSFELVEGIASPDSSVTIINAYVAKRNGAVAGMAIKVSRASYSGPVVLVTGVSVDKYITGIKIMELVDTPGLGANASSPTYFVDRARGITFYGQFERKSVADPFVVKDDVHSITASTITSRAVTVAVKAAGLAAAEWLSTGGSK